MGALDNGGKQTGPHQLENLGHDAGRMCALRTKTVRNRWAVTQKIKKNGWGGGIKK